MDNSLSFVGMQSAVNAVAKALFGRSLRRSAPMLFGQNAYDFDIVGELHHQDALERLAGGRKTVAAHVECLAFVAPEDGNPADEHAVVVTIQREKIGYFGREHAAAVRCRLFDLGVKEGATCRALICGGWDAGCGDYGYFGVKLDIVWPLCLET